MTKVAAVLIVLAALAAVAPFVGSYVLVLMTQALVLGIIAMSVDLLLGYTGLPSLGQAAYLGMGAYVTAILAKLCRRVVNALVGP